MTVLKKKVFSSTVSGRIENSSSRKQLPAYLFLCILIISLLVSAVLLGQQDKIIGFNHLKHLKRGIACTGCHTKVTGSLEASDNNLPEMDACLGCHDAEKAPNKCSLCHSNPDEPQPFPASIRSILFSHENHLGRKIGCQVCHAIEKKGKGMKLPDMERCVACHNGVNASKDCELCHISTDGLQPKSHVGNWKRNHKISSRTGENCAVCHEENFCQECHAGGVVFRTTKLKRDISDFFKPLLGSGEHVLKRVHEMNYRYTHPIDAVGKAKDCSICHQQQTFCQECHMKEGVVGRGRDESRPPWHGGDDWGIRGGYGSGGGRHAKLAKRDIERCASCHESGDISVDIVCLRCHRDETPGRGNDPRAHDRAIVDSFGEERNLHDAKRSDSICYVCHSYSLRNAANGFCKYCHGK